ncbi:zinc finger protein 418-like isoform X1 [Conger conger]|uniref:zinc finger protein 418-like isoform X1 n=2 Tax=Conger conger TaxID=82655 RepID=UPI002A5A460B|nr:zinc finger protein 418-like isoform X1 [Conger conger]
MGCAQSIDLIEAIALKLITDFSTASVETEMNQAQTSISSRILFTPEEDPLKEEQMEMACDQRHTDLQGDAEESYEEDQNERHTRSTEARALIDNNCLSASSLLAVGQDQRLDQPALEEEEVQVHPGGEEATGKGDRTLPAPVSSPGSGLIAGRVTELGTVHIVEDLCLAPPFKKEECSGSDDVVFVDASSDARSDPASATVCGISSSEDLTLNSTTRMVEQSHPPACRRPSPEEEHQADQPGLSDFELLRARLLSGQTSSTSPSDCKLCGRSFSLPETLHIHQLLHRLDDVCSCAVCGRSVAADSQSGRDQCRCDDCGRSSVQRRSLKRHRRTQRPGAVCADA